MKKTTINSIVPTYMPELPLNLSVLVLTYPGAMSASTCVQLRHITSLLVICLIKYGYVPPDVVELNSLGYF